VSRELATRQAALTLRQGDTPRLLGVLIWDTPVPGDGVDSTQRRRDLRDRGETVDAHRAAPCVALTSRIIELGIRVHRRLGPGLLESIYEECLCWELRHSGIAHMRQVLLAVTYEDMRLGGAYRADIIVEQ
jgi:hypothetical protein